jgi:DNA modification methylase
MLIDNSLYLGDCLEIMKSIDNCSIDLVLCDLPYGITTCKWDMPINMDCLWEEYKRIIKPGGAIILTATMPFGARLIMSNPKWFRHEIIWEKDNGSNPFSANKMPMRVHENILVFCEKGTIYNPQKTKGRPYIAKVNGTSFNLIPNKIRIPTINSGYRYPRSIQKFNSERGLHPTQKPVSLFEWLINTYSNEENLVLDNCIGSGTTAIAAINTNRRYIGIEKDENIYDIAQERISNYVNDLGNIGKIPTQEQPPTIGKKLDLQRQSTGLA